MPCRWPGPSWRRRGSRTFRRRPTSPPPPPQQKAEPMTSATVPVNGPDICGIGSVPGSGVLDITPVPGPGILDIAPYVGGDATAPGAVRPIRLASNESALGPSPKAIAAYRALAKDIHRYPDGSAAQLREALGRHHGLDPERIVCGSGFDELIGLLIRAYAGPGSEVLYSRHGFLMYPIGAQAVGATPGAVPERDLTAY